MTEGQIAEREQAEGEEGIAASLGALSLGCSPGEAAATAAAAAEAPTAAPTTAETPPSSSSPPPPPPPSPLVAMEGDFSALEEAISWPSRHGAELAQSVPGERVRPWQADLGHRRHLHAHAGQGLQRAAMGRLVGPRSSSAPCERALCAPFAVHDVDAYTICARSPARTHAIARILLRGVATSSAAHSSSTARSASRASSATSTATACTLAPCAGTVPSVAETCPMQVSPGRNVRTERKRADGRAWNNASAEKNA